MSFSTAIGTLGVTLLLGAFVLNLLGILAARATSYQLLNAIGAGLSCYASYLIGYAPFVILEATWCGVALVALLRSANRKSIE